jgi:hypothetical protein
MREPAASASRFTRDHASDEILARAWAEPADKSNTAQALRDARGAREGVGTAAGHPNDSEALQCEFIGEPQDVRGPGTNRAARLERGFAEAGTIGSKQPQLQVAARRAPPGVLQDENRDSREDRSPADPRVHPAPSTQGCDHPRA